MLKIRPLTLQKSQKNSVANLAQNANIRNLSATDDLNTVSQHGRSA